MRVHCLPLLLFVDMGRKPMSRLGPSQLIRPPRGRPVAALQGCALLDCDDEDELSLRNAGRLALRRAELRDGACDGIWKL